MIFGRDIIEESVDRWAKGERSPMFNSNAAPAAQDSPRTVTGPANDRQLVAVAAGLPAAKK